MKILKERINSISDFEQPVEQAGCRKKFATIDHIQTLNQLVEKEREYQIDLCVCLLFIDFNKVFNSIHHRKVCEVLRAQEVPAEINKTIKIYTIKQKHK